MPAYIPNWQPIRAALEKAYDELGLKMVRPDPMSATFQEHHWALAVSIYNQAQSDQQEMRRCQSTGCGIGLDFHTVIRCLDCRMQMCANCAKHHFGPQHGGRAQLAHG
jgi:hypothetical protein